jgi:hypothetical protein
MAIGRAMLSQELAYSAKCPSWDIRRKIEDELGAQPYEHIHAICGAPTSLTT